MTPEEGLTFAVDNYHVLTRIGSKLARQSLIEALARKSADELAEMLGLAIERLARGDT